MTEFNTATYEAVTQEIRVGVVQMGVKCDELITATNRTLSMPLLPGWLADALTWCVDRIVEATKWMVDKVGRCS